MVGSKWLLDTNAIIALQRNDDALTTLLANQSDIFVPSIAIGELFFGAYKSARAAENRQAVIAFAAGRVILQPDVTTGDFYGQVTQLATQRASNTGERHLDRCACDAVWLCSSDR